MEAKIDEILAMRGQLGNIDGVARFFTSYDEVICLANRLGCYAALDMEKDQSDNKSKELYANSPEFLNEVVVVTI